jgi:hypothetical protein
MLARGRIAGRQSLAIATVIVAGAFAWNAALETHLAALLTADGIRTKYDWRVALHVLVALVPLVLVCNRPATRTVRNEAQRRASAPARPAQTERLDEEKRGRLLANQRAAGTSPALRGTVIFRPQIAGLRPITQRYFGRLAMTDFGDHVEWTDGKRITTMRLPDQQDNGAGYPVLASVLLAGIKGQPYLPGRVMNYFIRFLDPDDVVIAWLGPRADTPAAAVPRILPEPEAYRGLIARGVQLKHAEYDDIGSLYEDYPDPRIHGVSLFLARHPWLGYGGPIIAIIVIVLSVMAAMGKFSSS